MLSVGIQEEVQSLPPHALTGRDTSSFRLLPVPLFSIPHRANRKRPTSIRSIERLAIGFVNNGR
jgi:hypothetical protein